jgi:hypothetical protein
VKFKGQAFCLRNHKEDFLMSFRLGVLAAVTAIAAIVGVSPSAQANYFVWTDPDSELTLSYPDTWMRINNQKPDDVFSVSAPSGVDMATCRVSVREDKRFLFYPQRYRDAVQKVAYSTDFWSGIFAGYDNVKVHSYLDGAGLGRGLGSYALITYDELFPKADVKGMAGIMLVSLDHDDAYIASCSSKKVAFDRWRGYFGSFLASIETKKIHHDLFVGEYRDFLNDINIIVNRPDGLETTKY